MDLQFESIRSQIFSNPYLSQFAVLTEEKTKVKSEYVAVGVIFILVVMLFTGFGASLICYTVGFVYPFIKSINMMEGKAVSHDERLQWITYWILNIVINILENYIDFILYLIPFFYPLKLSIIMLLMLPQYQGAKMIYNQIVTPIVTNSGIKNANK